MASDFDWDDRPLKSALLSTTAVKPPRGAGDYRHIYAGQESVLHDALQKRGLTLEQFNAFWDAKDAAPYREPRALARRDWPEGHLANVAVHPSAPAAYARMMAIRESGIVPDASMDKWGARPSMRECTRLDPDGTLWVPLPWLFMIGLHVRDEAERLAAEKSAGNYALPSR